MDNVIDIQGKLNQRRKYDKHEFCQQMLDIIYHDMLKDAPFYEKLHIFAGGIETLFTYSLNHEKDKSTILSMYIFRIIALTHIVHKEGIMDDKTHTMICDLFKEIENNER